MAQLVATSPARVKVATLALLRWTSASRADCGPGIRLPGTAQPVKLACHQLSAIDLQSLCAQGVTVRRREKTRKLAGLE